jgi:hypothetical protein
VLECLTGMILLHTLKQCDTAATMLTLAVNHMMHLAVVIAMLQKSSTYNVYNTLSDICGQRMLYEDST